jgi:hypothetical protein
MRVRPWPIIIIALIHIFAPIFNIGYSAHLNHVNFLDYLEYILVNKKPIENVFWIALPVITGCSILQFRRWSYFLLLSFTIIVSSIFIHDWWMSPKMPLTTFVFLESMNVVILGYFLLPSVRNVYLKPSLRWWEQKPRYLVDQPILIETPHATSSGFIRNISEGGCLIETNLEFSRGDIFKISFEIFQKKFTMQNQIIHKGHEGYGTFFTKVAPSQNDLNKLIDQFAVQGYPLRTEIPDWKQSLKLWLGGAVKGKGLLPQVEGQPQSAIRSTPKANKDA